MGCHTSGNLMDVIGILDEDFGILLRILKIAKPKGKHPLDGIATNGAKWLLKNMVGLKAIKKFVLIVQMEEKIKYCFDSFSNYTEKLRGNKMIWRLINFIKYLIVIL